MNTITLAAIAAAAAEVVLCGLTGLFGHVGPCTFDTIAGVALFFHLPGIMISELLFKNSDMAGLVFILLSGAVQFFLIAWPVISAWRKVGSRAPEQG